MEEKPIRCDDVPMLLPSAISIFASASFARSVDGAMTTVNGSAAPPALRHKPTPTELQGAVSQVISEVRKAVAVCLAAMHAYVSAKSAGVSFDPRHQAKQNFTCVGLA